MIDIENDIAMFPVMQTFKNIAASSPRSSSALPVHCCSPPAVRQCEAPGGEAAADPAAAAHETRGPGPAAAAAGGKVTPPAKCSRITMPMCTC